MRPVKSIELFDKLGPRRLPCVAHAVERCSPSLPIRAWRKRGGADIRNAKLIIRKAKSGILAFTTATSAVVQGVAVRGGKNPTLPRYRHICCLLRLKSSFPTDSPARSRNTGPVKTA